MSVQRVGHKWTPSEEIKLLSMSMQKQSVKEMSETLQRTTGGIVSRLKHIAVRMAHSGYPLGEICAITTLTETQVVCAITGLTEYEIAQEQETTKEATKAEDTLSVLKEIRDLLRIYVHGAAQDTK